MNHHFDISACEDICGDKDLVKVFLNRFRSALKDSVTTIASQYATQDIRGLRLTAHSLKGSSGMVAASLLVRVAKQIQDACDEGGEEPHLGKLVAELQALAAAAQTELDVILLDAK